ncbi:MAG TPA: hypothetical protein VKA83_14785 [Methylomirabilota bacterium]|nr:hypothetical protein [Methylomirabilota bacterium]
MLAQSTRSLFILTAALLTASDSGPRALAASQPETFDWAGQQISLAPPPAGWRREGQSSGGIRGARFVKERSVGEAIGVGDYYLLAERLRRAKLQEIIGQFDTFDGHDFQKALRNAYAFTDSPFSPLEAEVAADINAALGRATAAFRMKDRGLARAELGVALGAAERLRFTLDDVLERVVFTPERPEEPQRPLVVGRREATIAGEPAVIVDYTLDTRERTLHGREAYVVHNSHLFVATFRGLEENLPVFDRVIESIRFPR